MKQLWDNYNPIASYFRKIPAVNPVSGLCVEELAVPGSGYVVRDMDSGLEWLNLAASLGKNFAEVSAACSNGGELEGWSYATLSEAQGLISRFGFDLTAPQHHESNAQLRQSIELMNEYLGETLDASGAFPDMDYCGSVMMTASKNSQQHHIALIVFYQRCSEQCNIDIAGGIGVGVASAPPYASSLLVRRSGFQH